jgi:hypothetical protein
METQHVLSIATPQDEVPSNVVFRAVTLQSQQIHKLIVFLKKMSFF